MRCVRAFTLRRDRVDPSGETSANTTGMTTSASTLAEASPPTMGAAIRLIASAPVPDAQRIGSRPAMVDVTVIAIGLNRSNAPSRTAASRSSRV